MDPGCLGHSHELAQRTPEGKTRPLRALGRAEQTSSLDYQGWRAGARPSGNSRVGARMEDCSDQSWAVRRAPRSWVVVPGSRYPFSPRLSPQPLEFGSYHCGQSTIEPPGVVKMARGPGARRASGPRTQGAGPEENPGGRAAQDGAGTSTSPASCGARDDAGACQRLQR